MKKVERLAMEDSDVAIRPEEFRDLNERTGWRGTAEKCCSSSNRGKYPRKVRPRCNGRRRSGRYSRAGPAGHPVWRASWGGREFRSARDHLVQIAADDEAPTDGRAVATPNLDL
jgi:hypothetical protein